ncbi:MAG: nucleoside deaminase [Methylococcales bacterium]|jgi:tRNA(Arg) A34 adenosine deaminase TadA|nr:nucleoside deaminase [Methylococcales bacterium]MBT7409911.1 nucleoside deaminase [Methylococcales bacterium]
MDNNFIQLAVELAKNSIEKHNGGPFGAVVVLDGKVVGRGYNQVTKNCDPTAHAEVNAIRDACKNLGTFHLHDCDLYTSCEPCPMCFSAIYWAHIKNVYYASTHQQAANAGFDDTFIGTEFRKINEERNIHFIENLLPEAEDVFVSWRHKMDKIKY